tara:strand:+ start:448 stop:1260 length:813 start_codon:yes stop_codon:yes gene_type:complete
MAIPNTKATLKSYCLRSLGFGVIDINVSDDQVDDRIDEALQYFSHYSYDGVERMYLKYQITADDVARAAGNTSTTATDSSDSSITATFKEGGGFIPMPSSVISVMNIFPFDNTATNNMFDIRYQLRLNDLYDFSSTSIVQYEMTMQHLDFLSHILIGEKPLRFNEHQNRLYIDMDWANDISIGEFLVIECYRKLDPATFTDMFDDIFLKRYTTALIKRQWGANLSKFSGVAMLGGVTMNGETIFSQALEEIKDLEDRMFLNEPPIDMFKG